MKRSRRFIPLLCVWAGAAGTVRAQERGCPTDAIAEARVLAADGEYQAVIRALEPVAESRRDFEVHWLLGLAYWHTGDRPAARRALRAAVRLEPTRAEAHSLLGDVYLSQKRFGLAEAAYRQAQGLGLDTAQLHLDLATTYFHLSSFTGRVETRTVLGGQPGEVADRAYLIEPVPGEAGRFFVAPERSAIYHLQRALDGGIDTPRVHLLQADIWVGAGRHARALAIYRRIEGQVPQDQRARYFFGRAGACLGTDDLEGYVEDLRRAVALDRKTYGGHLAAAYGRAAEYYGAEGDLDNYIHYLELAAGESSASADLHYRLGNALYEAGRQVEASRRWRLTLELEPDHPDRERMLELVRLFTGSATGAP